VVHLTRYWYLIHFHCLTAGPRGGSRRRLGHGSSRRSAGAWAGPAILPTVAEEGLGPRDDRGGDPRGGNWGVDDDVQPGECRCSGASPVWRFGSPRSAVGE